MICNGILNDHKEMCSSCTKYIVLFAIFLITSTIICSVLVYFHWCLKKDNIPAKFNPIAQTTLY